MKKINIFLFNLLFIVLLSSNVLAFFPVSHKAITNDLFSMQLDSNLYKACKNNLNLCLAGDILTDSSVTYYYSERDKYIYTHSTSFVIALIQNANSDKELACAVGAGLHQSQDIVAHTFLVPYAIKHTLLPNNIIHIYGEQHLDNILLSENPSLKQDVALSLNDFEDCVPLFKRVLQGSLEYQEVDLDAIFAKFIAEVQGSKTGYDVSFNNVTALPVFLIILYSVITLFFTILTLLLVFRKNKNILNWITLVISSVILLFFIILFISNLTGNAFNTLVFVIKPISNLVPIGNAHGYVTQAVENSKQFFIQGESFLYNKDSSGFDTLNAADNSILIGKWIILILITIGLVYLLYLNFKKTKNK